MYGFFFFPERQQNVSVHEMISLLISCHVHSCFVESAVSGIAGECQLKALTQIKINDFSPLPVTLQTQTKIFLDTVSVVLHK